MKAIASQVKGEKFMCFRTPRPLVSRENQNPQPGLWHLARYTVGDDRKLHVQFFDISPVGKLLDAGQLRGVRVFDEKASRAIDFRVTATAEELRKAIEKLGAKAFTDDSSETYEPFDRKILLPVPPTTMPAR